MQVQRELVGARESLGSPRADIPFDPDCEEAGLLAILEEVLARSGRAIDPAVRSGACRSRHRARLESAIATGRWARSRRLVRECVHRGAHIAIMLAERQNRPIDESLVELTCRVIESNRSLIRLRLRAEDVLVRAAGEGLHG